MWENLGMGFKGIKREGVTEAMVQPAGVFSLVFPSGCVPGPGSGTRPPLRAQASGFVEGVRPRAYKPLLARPKCQGLEARIRHFARRGRIPTPREEEEEDMAAGDEAQQPPKRVCVGGE